MIFFLQVAVVEVFMMNMAVGQSLCAILLVLLYVVPESSCAQPRVFTIGGIVSSKETQQVLKEAVDKANQEHLLPQGESLLTFRELILVLLVANLSTTK